VEFQEIPRMTSVSIQKIIAEGELKVSSQLEARQDDILRWNSVLKQIFQDQENLDRWNHVFLPSFLLRNQTKLYQEILGI